ncbi:hypothetical protein EDC04DRAFT_2613985 [Pisolithus marmoratus]|nr:hypothetical protein EDC04DRAFT_2613985 [Pisolithus marmoratus]
MNLRATHIELLNVVECVFRLLDRALPLNEVVYPDRQRIRAAFGAVTFGIRTEACHKSPVDKIIKGPPWTIEAASLDAVLVGIVEGHTIYGNQQSNAPQDTRLVEVVPVPLLPRRCQSLCADDGAPKAKNGARTEVYIENSKRWHHAPSHIDYDRQLNTHSEVQQLKEPKVKFDVTEDVDDERRALEEE